MVKRDSIERVSTRSICFISPFMGPLLATGSKSGTGGAERQFYLFGAELAKRGWRVIFIADCPLPCANLPENVRVLHVPFAHLGGRKWRFFSEILKLLWALMLARADYYAVKNAPQFAGCVCLYQVFRHAKLIMWGQTNTSFDRVVANEPTWLRMIRWLGIRRAAVLIAQTLEQAERALKAFGKRASVVPNITLPPSTTPCSVDEKGYVFWCGNHSPNKRAEVFLELAKLMPGRKFVMAMNGEASSERYQALKTTAQQIENLRFLGSVPPSNIDAWFEGADIYVNTSIREGFPNTFLQSWQQGHPVVSINIDPERNMDDEKLGHCLYSDEQHLREKPDLLARQLRSVVGPLLENQKARAEYATTCRNYVERVHSAPVVIARFVDVIRGVEHGLA